MNNRKSYLIQSILLACIGLLLYSFSLSPGVYWWDSGEFIASIYRLGIPHPTGFPIYILIGKLFSTIPIATITFRVNFISAFFGAGAIVYLYHLTLRFISSSPDKSLFSKTSAFFAALSLMISLTFWSQSVIAEVYTMNIFFLVGCTYHFILYEQTLQLGINDNRNLYLAGLLLGLGLAVHAEMILLIPAIVCLFISPSIRKTLNPPRLLIFIGMVMLGRILYLFIPIRASFHPLVNWGDPEILSKFWAYSTQAEFKQKMFSRSSYVMWVFAEYAGKCIVRNFTWIGILLGSLGAISQLRSRILYFLVTSSVFMGNIFLALVYGNEQRFEPEFSSFLIPAYLIWALWMGLGVFNMLVMIKDKLQIPLSLMKGISLALFLFPVYLGFHHYPAIHQMQNNTPARFGKTILDSIPPNSTVFVRDVYMDFISLYLQQVEGYRTDLNIISFNRKQGLSTNWKTDFLNSVNETPVFAEYDIVANNGLENHFQPFGYLGKLVRNPVSEATLLDYNNNDALWDKISSEFHELPVGADPIIIRDLHPFAVSKANLSVLYARKNQWGYAFDESQKSNAFEPEYSESYLNRGIWYLNSDKIDLAKTELEKYVLLNPVSHDGWLDLGTAYAKLKRLENAISCFSRALKIDSHSQQANLSLGIAYVQIKDYSRAETCFRRLVSDYPKKTLYVSHLARILTIQGKTKEAQGTWQKVLELDPNNAEAKDILTKL